MTAPGAFDWLVTKPFRSAELGAAPPGDSASYVLASYSIDGVPRRGWTFLPLLSELVRDGYLGPHSPPWRLRTRFEAASGVRDGSNVRFGTTKDVVRGLALLDGLVRPFVGTHVASIDLEEPPPVSGDTVSVLYESLEAADLSKHRWTIGEELSGTKNGVNLTFTSSEAPYLGDGFVAVSGRVVDRTIVGSTWTIAPPAPPDSGDRVRACYPVADSGATAAAWVWLERLEDLGGGAYGSAFAPLGSKGILVAGDWLLDPLDFSIVGSTWTPTFTLDAPPLAIYRRTA